METPQSASSPLADGGIKSSPSGHTQAKPESQTAKTLKTNPFVLLLIAVFFVGSLVASTVLISNYKPKPAKPIPNTRATTPPVATYDQEKKTIANNLTQRQLDQLSSIKTQFYMPSSKSRTHSHALYAQSASSIGYPMLLFTITSADTSNMTVMQLTVPDGFDPPANCGPISPEGRKTSRIVPCRAAQVPSINKFKAYVYSGAQGPGSTTTQSATVYAVFDNTLIIASSYSAGAEEVIKELRGFEPIKTSELPFDTTLIAR